MEILTGQKLVETLRTTCDKASKRLWIASPFIGHWSSVRRILGRKWVDEGSFSVRLITDLLNANNFNYETMKYFYDRGTIKEIKGLHAKIYIIDNDVLVTSANLTNTAFSKRHEVGIFLYDREAEEIVKLYIEWWENTANNISANWLPKVARKHVNTEKEETVDHLLETLWKLPSDPGAPGKILAQRFLDYEAFRSIYNDFASTYAKMQRVWPKRPLYFETDSFLNYLFHHAPGLPTKKYYKIKPRILSNEEKEKEIAKYARLFKNWILCGSEGIEAEPWREEHSQRVKKLLNKDSLGDLDGKKIKQIADCLHCLNSMPIQKHKFLNPKNNDIQTIKNAWKDLLYGEDPLPVRMNRCKDRIKYFGRSSIQEILGNYDPEKYPIRNANCNSGLRFFGYDVSSY